VTYGIPISRPQQGHMNASPAKTGTLKPHSSIPLPLRHTDDPVFERDPATRD
jgi:hypothetical protein